MQYYSGAAHSGNLIKTETTTYQTLPDPYPQEMKSYAQAPQLPLSTTTTWANGQVSKVAQLYDCGYFSWMDDNSGGTRIFTCPAPSTNPAYGLVTSKTNYDYPGGSSTLSTTNTTYKALPSDSDASSYLSVNLLDLTCLVTIYGPGSLRRHRRRAALRHPFRLIKLRKLPTNMTSPPARLASTGIFYLSHPLAQRRHLAENPASFNGDWNPDDDY